MQESKNMSSFNIIPPEQGLPNDNTRVYSPHRIYLESKPPINFRTQSLPTPTPQSMKNAKITNALENLDTDYKKVISADENGNYYIHFPHAKYGKVQPELHEALLKLEDYALTKGYIIVRNDGERSCAASNTSRAQKGTYVAKGGESPHNYGAGADLCIYNIETGKICSFHSKHSNKEIKDIVKYAKEECGLAWGGDWSMQYENHHFELANWKSKYKTKQNLIENIAQSRHTKVQISTLRA